MIYTIEFSFSSGNTEDHKLHFIVIWLFYSPYPPPQHHTVLKENGLESAANLDISSFSVLCHVLQSVSQGSWRTIDPALE